MKQPTLIAALLTFLLPLAACPAAPRPNIVVLLADDMGFSDIACYGSEIPTPHLDALAASGVKLSQFYNTGRCCPTRASLLTGLYPHQAGVGHMTGRPTTNPGYRAELTHDNPTIAEVLRAAGYSTYMAGKWHVTSNARPDAPKDNWPMQRGFDRYYGTIMGGGSYYDPAMLTRDNTPLDPTRDPEYQPDHFYYTTALADQASRFVRDHHERSPGRPFFLYVAFTAPHWPLHAPADVVARYKGKYDAGYAPVRDARIKRQHELGLIPATLEAAPLVGDWDAVTNKPWEARCMEVYAAQVDLLDQAVGKVVASLKESNQLDNTLVIFLSDNGGCAEAQGRKADNSPNNQKPVAPGQPQLNVRPRFTRTGQLMTSGPETLPGPDTSFIAYGQSWANVSNTPFREYKHWVHEGGISTPFIASYPAAIKHRDDYLPTPAHLIDLMPTFAELAGATFPKSAATPLEGTSLVPLFHNEQLTRPNPIFFEHEGNRAVRDNQWKLVAKGPRGGWELYDMTTDRTELHDLSKSHPDLVKSLSDQWTAWATRAHVLPLMAYQTAAPRAKPADE